MFDAKFLTAIEQFQNPEYYWKTNVTQDRYNVYSWNLKKKIHLHFLNILIISLAERLSTL